MEYQEDIKFFLDEAFLAQLKRCVIEASPNEACGICFGTISQIPNEDMDGDYFYHYIGQKFSCIKSDKQSTVAFLIENMEQLHHTILKAIKELGIKDQTRLICIFHSHPSGSYPSTTDIENMKFLNEFSDIDNKFISKAFKNLIWLIMNGSTFELNGFLCLNSQIYQIDIKIRD